MKALLPFRPFLRLIAAPLSLVAVLAGAAGATPSTQIWIPSTDIQPYGTLHFGSDVYLRTNSNSDGSRTPPMVDLGVTGGVLPYEKVQAEIGIDVLAMGTAADKNPFYFNGKIGTPEGSLFMHSPAIAVGGYNFGTKDDVTNFNIVYGLVAKTFPVVGRLSAGWFVGNDRLLVDGNGAADEKGLLLSWDRPMPEISDKLWLAVDYQGTDSLFGALSFGFSWAFAKNTSVIFGYDIYNDQNTGGENTFTVQVDINF